MISWLDREAHLTLRVTLLVVGAIVAVYLWTGRAPKVSPQITTSVATAAQAVKDAQQAISAARAIQSGAASLIQRPAVTVVQPLDTHLSGAEWAAILHAAGNQPTRTVYRAQDTVAAPTPPPMPTAAPSGFNDIELSQLEQADEVATATQLRKTTVQTHVTVSQEPAPPSRVSTAVLSDGAAGAAYTLRRRGQVDFDLGVAAAPGQFEGFAAGIYRLRGTGLGLGPYASFGGRRWQIGVAAAIGI